MSESKQIFTLKQVVSSIRKTIEDRYQQLYWVKAEMHKLNLYPSGHAFPELVYKENGKIEAQIGASIWKQNFQRINKQFVEVVKEPLKEGTTLLLQVRVTFHETFGLSLQIIDIDPNYSLGELQREREETLKRLQKEQLLNLNQQLDFPLLPQRIAIISADTSKGLMDFMKVLNNNSWKYAFFTHLFPAYLQGDVAGPSIIKQLKRIEKVKSHFDVAVIVRGGGGEVGLSCYNNYELCAEIAKFPLPVLTGIGHSTNMTVAELIAFRNAITPTELADFLLQAFHDFSIPVNDAFKTIKLGALRTMENSLNSFNSTTKLFKSGANAYLLNERKELKAASLLVKNEVRTIVSKNKEQLNFHLKDIHLGSKRFFAIQQELISQQKSNLNQQTKLITAKSNQNLLETENMVRILDPINVLKRGFSITTINEKAVASIDGINPGTIIKTRVFDGTFESEIKKIN